MDVARITDEVYAPLLLPRSTIKKTLSNVGFPPSHAETQPLEVLPSETLKREDL
jgi:hypothetical protein